MSDRELEELAAGEALAMADSSRIEGLILDEEAIRAGLLAGYRKIKVEAQNRISAQLHDR